ncbi:hypothetical protein DPMN_062699 [Dreissena polymorpha]|uniref:Uncharacterized protein n=1 Tax=Dreissena polymorpha TaxID=45954 RepID=A0A9D4CA92_DREPO|nr:hypothetical protein DPMN_062699 [Dreissena polymorpha]
MKFNALKYISRITKKDKPTNRYILQVQNEEIPSIMKSPIQCIGIWFYARLQDSDNVRKLETQVD